MDCNGSDSKTYFAEVASLWDEIRSGYFTEEMRDDAIQKARVGSQDVVADVGTGTGFVVKALAPRVKKVYGIDESAEMLEVAKRNLSGVGNVEWIEASGLQIPLPDGFFDAIFANMYLHHTPDPSAALIEMVRTLKPGGRLVVTDLDQHSQSWMREAMADRWLGFRRDDIHTWLGTAGLINVNIECAKGGCCARKKDEQEVVIGIFVAVGTAPRL
jgi:ubiquinone/menaquinone biosynthesis C-methylase UbiE